MMCFGFTHLFGDIIFNRISYVIAKILSHLLCSIETRVQDDVASNRIQPLLPCFIKIKGFFLSSDEQNHGDKRCYEETNEDMHTIFEETFANIVDLNTSFQ